MNTFLPPGTLAKILAKTDRHTDKEDYRSSCRSLKKIGTILNTPGTNFQPREFPRSGKKAIDVKEERRLVITMASYAVGHLVIHYSANSFPPSGSGNV